MVTFSSGGCSDGCQGLIARSPPGGGSLERGKRGFFCTETAFLLVVDIVL